MKNTLLLIIISLYGTNCLAQQIVERKNRLTSDVTERFQTIIETNKQVKNGPYHAFFNKKTVVASGNYTNDKRTGTWHFFDLYGDVSEQYDYDNNKLLYEAPDDKVSPIRYVVDHKITDTDVVTKPIRLGGRYFGYIPYLKLFNLPSDLDNINTEGCTVVLELLISPMGRLADYSIHIRYNENATDFKVLNINTDRLIDDDKTFIPATFNKKPIASQIIISCYIDRFGGIDIY